MEFGMFGGPDNEKLRQLRCEVTVQFLEGAALSPGQMVEHVAQALRAS